MRFTSNSPRDFYHGHSRGGVGNGGVSPTTALVALAGFWEIGGDTAINKLGFIHVLIGTLPPEYGAFRLGSIR